MRGGESSGRISTLKRSLPLMLWKQHVPFMTQKAGSPTRTEPSCGTVLPIPASRTGGVPVLLRSHPAHGVAATAGVD